MTDMTRPRRAGYASEAGTSFSSRNAPQVSRQSKDRKPESRRESLPQCIAACRDGRELLLDSRGFPMFQRAGAGKPARPADALEHLVGIVRPRLHLSAASEPPHRSCSAPPMPRRARAMGHFDGGFRMTLIPSPRVRHLARRVHALGWGALGYLFAALIKGGDPRATIESFADLDAEVIQSYGGATPIKPYAIEGERQ